MSSLFGSVIDIVSVSEQAEISESTYLTTATDPVQAIIDLDAALTNTNGNIPATKYQDVINYLHSSTVGATLTATQVKSLYESNYDTNNFNNTEKGFLDGLIGNTNFTTTSNLVGNSVQGPPSLTGAIMVDTTGQVWKRNTALPPGTGDAWTTQSTLPAGNFNDMTYFNGWMYVIDDSLTTGVYKTNDGGASFIPDTINNGLTSVTKLFVLGTYLVAIVNQNQIAYTTDGLTWTWDSADSYDTTIVRMSFDGSGTYFMATDQRLYTTTNLGTAFNQNNNYDTEFIPDSSTKTSLLFSYNGTTAYFPGSANGGYAVYTTDGGATWNNVNATTLPGSQGNPGYSNASEQNIIETPTFYVLFDNGTSGTFWYNRKDSLANAWILSTTIAGNVLRSGAYVGSSGSTEYFEFYASTAQGTAYAYGIDNVSNILGSVLLPNPPSTAYATTNSASALYTLSSQNYIPITVNAGPINTVNVQQSIQELELANEQQRTLTTSLSANKLDSSTAAATYATISSLSSYALSSDLNTFEGSVANGSAINTNGLALSKLVQLGGHQILGNVSGTTGNVSALSGDNVATCLDATMSDVYVHTTSLGSYETASHASSTYATQASLGTTNSNVATNTSNISTNTANIATNTSNISTNTTNITNLQNGTGQTINSLALSKLQQQTAYTILSNNTGSTANVVAITSNNLGTMLDSQMTDPYYRTSTANSTFATQTSLATTNSNVSTNTTNIATNTSNISTNTSNIATNTSNISTNTTNITNLQNGTGQNTNSLALSKLVQVSNDTVLGNQSGSTGNIVALTATQLVNIIRSYTNPAASAYLSRASLSYTLNGSPDTTAYWASAAAIVAGTWTLFDTWDGHSEQGSFSFSSGTWTLPNTGTYRITFNLGCAILTGSTQGILECGLSVNGANPVANTGVIWAGMENGTSNNGAISFNIHVNLTVSQNANDTIAFMFRPWRNAASQLLVSVLNVTFWQIN